MRLLIAHRAPSLGSRRCIHISKRCLIELQIKPKDLQEPVTQRIANLSNQVAGLLPDHGHENSRIPFNPHDNMMITFNNDANHLSVSHEQSPIVDPRILDIAQLISKELFFEAMDRVQSLFEEDREILQKLANSECSSLIRIAPSTFDQVEESWAKLKWFTQMMEYHSGHELFAADYAVLITVAFKARDFASVQSLWDETQVRGIKRTLELWKAYITSSCNAYPPMWESLQLTSIQKQRSKRESHHPVAVANAVNLVSEMIQDGISPDADIYERLILYMAQEKLVDNIRLTIKSIWGIEVNNYNEEDTNQVSNDAKTSEPTNNDNVSIYELIHQSVPEGFKLPHGFTPGVQLYPTYKTLEHIFIAFAVNDQVLEGMKVVFRMARYYDLTFTDFSSSNVWTRLFLVTFHKYGQRKISGHLLRQLFAAYTKTYCELPSKVSVKLMMHHFVSGGFYHKAEDLLPLLIKIGKKDAVSSLKILSKSMLDKGLDEPAFKILDRWAPVSPDFEILRKHQRQYAQNRQWIATATQIRQTSKVMKEQDIVKEGEVYAIINNEEPFEKKGDRVSLQDEYQQVLLHRSR